MAFGSTSNSQIGYIAEATWGTTPATPTFQILRRTSGGPVLRKGTVISDEVASNRNVIGEPQISHDVQGNMSIEMSNPVLDDFLESALCGAWATNVLKVGSTMKSFTIEEKIPVGATNNYHRYLGCVVNTLGLRFQSRSKVMTEVGLMGQKVDTLATAIITGATYTAASTDSIFTADKVASLSILGATPVVRALDLNITNNTRMRPKVGSIYSEEFGIGQAEITGRLEAYFESNTLFNSVMSHGTGEISFTVGVDSNEKYTFMLGTVQLLNGEVVLGGKDDDVMVNIDFRAVYDSGDASSIMITRLVA